MVIRRITTAKNCHVAALELYYKTTQNGDGPAANVHECSSEQSDDGNETISSGSDEETYISSPEVHMGHVCLNQPYVLQLHPFPLQTEKTCSQKQE